MRDNLKWDNIFQDHWYDSQEQNLHGQRFVIVLLLPLLPAYVQTVVAFLLAGPGCKWHQRSDRGDMADWEHQWHIAICVYDSVRKQESCETDRVDRQWGLEMVTEKAGQRVAASPGAALDHCQP